MGIPKQLIDFIINDNMARRLYRTLLGVIVIIGISTIVRINMGYSVELWGAKWNIPKDTAIQDTASTSYVANKGSSITTGGTSNTTHGDESPIMTGKGDYKPSKTFVSKKDTQPQQRNVNVRHAAQVGTNSGTFYNGDVTYKGGIKQRHATDTPILQSLNKFVSEIPSKDLPIHILVSGDDKEALSLANEIANILFYNGYTNIIPVIPGHLEMVGGPLGVIFGHLSSDKSFYEISIKKQVPETY